MANELARRLRRTMTPQEVKLWVYLRGWRVRGYHFRRQAPRDRYILDFVCLKHRLVVEVDGSQHGYFHPMAHDAERATRLRRTSGLRVLRFWNHEIDRNLDDVLETILAALEERPATPSR